MEQNKEQNKANILNRLRKIEGQVKGIYRMVEEGKYCGDVMIQISAIRSAINRVGGLMIDNYINECLVATMKDNEVDKDKLKNMVDILVKYVK